MTSLTPNQIREAQAKAQNLLAQVEAIVCQLNGSEHANAEAAFAAGEEPAEEATAEQLALVAIAEDVESLDGLLRCIENP